MGDKKITASRVREYAKSKGMRISSSSYDTLDAKVGKVIDSAIDRAKSNGRTTIKPSDL